MSEHINHLPLHINSLISRMTTLQPILIKSRLQECLAQVFSSDNRVQYPKCQKVLYPTFAQLVNSKTSLWLGCCCFYTSFTAMFEFCYHRRKEYQSKTILLSQSSKNHIGNLFTNLQYCAILTSIITKKYYLCLICKKLNCKKIMPIINNYHTYYIYGQGDV